MYPLLEKYLTGPKSAGLEIQLTAEGKIMHLIVLRRKRKEVIVEKEVTGIDSYEKLAAHLSKEIPLVIRITGKGVLYRRLIADPGAEQGKLLAKIFPNASLKDFCLETTPAAADEIYVSVLRKSVADEIAQQLKSYRFSLVDAGIGSPAVAKILPLFSGPKPEISFGNHRIQLKNDLPAEVMYQENQDAEYELETGGQKISATALPAFSAALEEIITVQKKAAEILPGFYRTDFLQQKLFRKGTAILLTLTLLVLLVNFLYFTHYREKEAELKNKLETNGGAFRDLAGLEKQVSEKRKFFSGSGLAGPSHHAFYADRLAAGLPREIILTEMNISPRVKLTEEDSIGFTPGEIILAGTCSESIILNRWIQELKKEKWIRNAELEKYTLDKAMLRGEFHILLSLQ